jgi:Fic family protein
MDNNASNTSELGLLLEKIEATKSAIDLLRPFSAEQEGRIMQKFRLDWTYHSNAIEGNSLTYGETLTFLMEGLTAKGKPFKDHLDIKGHNDGIDYLMHLIKHREQLSEKVIRELHEIILVEPYTSPAVSPEGMKVDKQVALGAYKSQPNHVKTASGQIHYYATPEETPARMTDLLDWYRKQLEDDSLHPLILAALFHYRFVAIHPFDDGNGRMSRLLMNLILMQHHYPPVVIKQQDRNNYFATLRQADAGETIPFIIYIGENLLHALNLQKKGAMGESIEDEDDLDKEITLLKLSLRQEKKNIQPKSLEVCRNLLEHTLYPLFVDLDVENQKFKELFFEITPSVRIADANQRFMERILNEEKMTHLLNELNEKYNKVEFYTKFSGFNSSRTPFDYVMKVEIDFFEFQYKIKIGYSNEYILEKYYTETINKEDKKMILQRYKKDVLETIKSKTQP